MCIGKELIYIGFDTIKFQVLTGLLGYISLRGIIAVHYTTRK